jgi:hypothetical protein
MVSQVGPNVWLARAWFVDIVGALNPSDPLPFTAPLVDIATAVENTTYNLAVEAIGFQGPNSTPTTSGGTYPNPVGTLRNTQMLTQRHKIRSSLLDSYP